MADRTNRHAKNRSFYEKASPEEADAVHKAIRSLSPEELRAIRGGAKPVENPEPRRAEIPNYNNGHQMRGDYDDTGRFSPKHLDRTPTGDEGWDRPDVASMYDSLPQGLGGDFINRLKREPDSQGRENATVSEKTPAHKKNRSFYEGKPDPLNRDVSNVANDTKRENRSKNRDADNVERSAYADAEVGKPTIVPTAVEEYEERGNFGESSKDPARRSIDTFGKDESTDYFKNLREHSRRDEPVEDPLTRDFLDGNISEVEYYKKLGVTPPPTFTGGRDISSQLKKGEPPAASRTDENGVTQNFDRFGNEIVGGGQPAVGYVAPKPPAGAGAVGPETTAPPGASHSGPPNASPRGSTPGPAGTAPPQAAPPQNPFAGGDPNELVSMPSNSRDSVTGAPHSAYVTRGEAAAEWDKAHPKPDPTNILGYRKSQYGRMGQRGFDTADRVEKAGFEELDATERVGEHLQRESDDAVVRAGLRRLDESERQAVVKQKIAKIDAVTEDAKKAELGGGSYLSRNPVSGIMYALSAIAGGAYAGLTGKENQGLKAFDSAIARDLSIQKYNLEKKQTNIANEKSLLGQMRLQFDDERHAEQATEITMRQLGADKLMGIAEGIKNVKMKNDVIMMAAEIRNSADQNKIELERALWLAKHARPAVAKMKQPELEKIIQYNGKSLKFRDGSLATKMGEKIAAHAQVEHLTKQIIEMRNNWDHISIPMGAKREKMQTLGENLMDALRQGTGAGTLDEGYVNHAMRMMGDPTSLTTAVVPKLQSIIDDGQFALDSSIKAQNPEEMTTGYSANHKTGRIEPDALYNGKRDKLVPMPKTTKRQ